MFFIPRLEAPEKTTSTPTTIFFDFMVLNIEVDVNMKCKSIIKGNIHKTYYMA